MFSCMSLLAMDIPILGSKYEWFLSWLLIFCNSGVLVLILLLGWVYLSAGHDAGNEDDAGELDLEDSDEDEPPPLRPDLAGSVDTITNPKGHSRSGSIFRGTNKKTKSQTKSQTKSKKKSTSPIIGSRSGYRKSESGGFALVTSTKSSSGSVKSTSPNMRQRQISREGREKNREQRERAAEDKAR